ncbi:hypothetical protein HaLaN_17998, partial [Haematococcus lacustris]
MRLDAANPASYVHHSFVRSSLFENHAEGRVVAHTPFVPRPDSDVGLNATSVAPSDARNTYLEPQKEQFLKYLHAGVGLGGRDDNSAAIFEPDAVGHQVRGAEQRWRLQRLQGCVHFVSQPAAQPVHHDAHGPVLIVDGAQRGERSDGSLDEEFIPPG